MHTSPRPKGESPDDLPSDVVGMPRRFGAGRLLALITFFAMVFALLRWLGAVWFVFLMVGLFFASMGLGQMLLYGGRRPRRASCVAGAVVLPVLFLVGMLAAFASDLGGGLLGVPGGLVAKLVSASILFIPIGAGLGYLAGGLVAGLFLVMDRRWDVGSHRTRRPKPRRKRLRRLLARLRRRPGRSALIGFAALSLLGIAVAPFVPYPSWWHVAGSLAVAAVIAFGLTGLFLSGRRMLIVFTVLGPLVATGPVMMTRPIYFCLLLPYFRRWQGRVEDVVQPALLIVVAGLAIGWMTVIALGWLRHWLTCRHPQHRRRVAIRLATLAALGLAILAGATVACSYPLRQRSLLIYQLQQKHVYVSFGTDYVLAMLNDADTDMAFLSQLQKVGTITALDLTGSHTSDRDLEQLRGLGSVKDLSLAETFVTDAGLKHLATLPRLEWLNLSRTHVTGNGFHYLRALPLRTLWLRESSLDDAGLEELVKNCPSLKCLVLEGTKVTAEGIVPVQSLASLEVLAIGRIPVDDAFLKKMSRMTRIESLDLGSTAVTDAGLAYLQPLPLRDLSLERTGVSDAGLKYIAKFPAIEEVDVSGTRVTPDGIQRLQSLKPNLDIRHAFSLEALDSPPDAVVLPEDADDRAKEGMGSRP